MENNNIPEIELIIKASTIDGRRKGACIFCQEYFMDLYLLAELKGGKLSKRHSATCHQSQLS